MVGTEEQQEQNSLGREEAGEPCHGLSGLKGGPDVEEMIMATPA